MLKVSDKDRIVTHVIENLISMHDRICKGGNVSDALLLSEFLIKLGEKRANVFIHLIPEPDEQRRS